MKSAVLNLCKNSEMVYLAGPYSSNDPLVKKKRMMYYNLVASYLLCNNAVPVSPLFMNPICEEYGLPDDYNAFTKYSRTLLSKCDLMLVLELEGWQNSIGLQDEIYYATSQYEIPVVHITEDELNALITNR